MLVLPSIETSQLICTANQLTGFYMRAALAFNGLNEDKPMFIHIKVSFLNEVGFVLSRKIRGKKEILRKVRGNLGNETKYGNFFYGLQKFAFSRNFDTSV